jgi:hypothetical protein
MCWIYLRDECVEAPGVCHLDLKAGKHKALKHVFPSTRIVGCDFNCKQVIILIIYLFLNNLFLFWPLAPTWASMVLFNSNTMT